MFARTSVLVQGTTATQSRLGVVFVVLAAALACGCLSDPQRVQSAHLLDRLIDARAAFGQADGLEGACNTVGEVQTRLVGEPGLSERAAAYEPLRQAAAALQAVCGTGTVLQQATADTESSQAARGRWRIAIEREMVLACEQLRLAAAILNRPPPC